MNSRSQMCWGNSVEQCVDKVSKETKSVMKESLLMGLLSHTFLEGFGTGLIKILRKVLAQRCGIMRN